MYIYADVILVVNFIMNSIILAGTAYATGISFRWHRLFLAALAGGIYVLLGVFPELKLLYGVPGKLAASVVLILAAFGRRPVKTTIILVGAFFIVSFVLGGATLGWLYFIQSESPYWSGNIVQVSWKTLTAGSAVTVILLLFFAKRMLGNMFRRKTLYHAKIEYDGRCEEIVGIMDTGNGLYSLLGRKPVVLLAWQSALKLVGSQVAAYLTANNSEVWLAKLDECKDSAWLARVEIIPCQSVGGKSMLLGFRPDSITVMTEDGSAYTSEVLIGLYDGVFGNGSDCQALLHPALITSLNTTKEAGICALPGR